MGRVVLGWVGVGWIEWSGVEWGCSLVEWSVCSAIWGRNPTQEFADPLGVWEVTTVFLRWDFYRDFFLD